MAFTVMLMISRRMIYLFLVKSRRRRWGERKNFVPMIDGYCCSKFLGPKKGKKRQKKNRDITTNYSRTMKYGSWLLIPYSNSKSYVYICCRNAYGRVLDDAFLRVPTSFQVSCIICNTLWCFSHDYIVQRQENNRSTIIPISQQYRAMHEK